MVDYYPAGGKGQRKFEVPLRHNNTTPDKINPKINDILPEDYSSEAMSLASRNSICRPIILFNTTAN